MGVSALLMSLQDFSKVNLKFYLPWQNASKAFNSLNSSCSDGEFLGCLVKKSPYKRIEVFPLQEKIISCGTTMAGITGISDKN